MSDSRAKPDALAEALAASLPIVERRDHDWECLAAQLGVRVDTCTRCGLLRYTTVMGERHYFVPWGNPYLACLGSLPRDADMAGKDATEGGATLPNAVRE